MKFWARRQSPESCMLSVEKSSVSFDVASLPLLPLTGSSSVMSVKCLHPHGLLSSLELQGWVDLVALGLFASYPGLLPRDSDPTLRCVYIESVGVLVKSASVFILLTLLKDHLAGIQF